MSRSLSPSIVVVPGSESSRAEKLAEDEFGPSVLVPILLEGPAGSSTARGRSSVARARQAARHAGDVRVELGETGRALRPAPTAAMIVASVARSERAMVDTVQEQIEGTVDAHRLR